MNIDDLTKINELVVDLNALNRHYNYYMSCSKNRGLSSITFNQGDGTQDTFSFSRFPAMKKEVEDAYHASLIFEISKYEQLLNSLGVDTPSVIRLKEAA